MKKVISILLLASLVLIGCSGNKENVKDETGNKEEGSMENPIATIVFKDLGEMTFELNVKEAPQSVYNFTELANGGYYDGLGMHRIVENFVAQGGDPDGTGAGGPGYSIKGEFFANDVENNTGHNLGSIAFARSQMADSAGSQFYIVLDEYDPMNRKRMDNDYAAFGTMLTGQDLLKVINEEYASGGGAPKKELIIESIKVDTNGVDLPSPEKLK